MYVQTRSDNKRKSLFMSFAAVVMAVVLLFILTGCGSAVEQDDVVGTWKCSYTDSEGTEPAEMEFELVFADDGTFTYNAYINGEEAGYDNGTYEIKDKKLALHSSVDNEDKECEISGDKLVFFENEYTKAD